MTSTPNRSRRLSSGSTTEASLFPIYEDPEQDTIPLFSDMESVAGSEAGGGDDRGARDGLNGSGRQHPTPGPPRPAWIAWPAVREHGQQ